MPVKLALLTFLLATSAAVAETPTANLTIRNRVFEPKEVNVPAGQKTLRIALCYSDFPGRGLINNLNLIVTSPTGKKAVGNQPSGSSSLTLDSANNVEVVEVPKAKSGTWTVDVVASNIAKGPQDFAIAAVLV